MSRSQRFFQLPGVSFVALGMPGGLIHGIEIDNSSGAWLFIPTLETNIPPYRVGWSMDIPYGATSIDIIANLPGPASQISTIQGSGVTVYLSGEAVGASPGRDTSSSYGAVSPDAGDPFISGFTIVNTFADQTPVRWQFPLNDLLIAAIPGKRFRIRTSEVTLVVPVGAPNPYGADSGVWYQIESTLAAPIKGRLTTQNPESFRTFSNGNDWPVGEPVRMEAFADFADVLITRAITYEII